MKRRSTTWVFLALLCTLLLCLGSVHADTDSAAGNVELPSAAGPNGPPLVGVSRDTADWSKGDVEVKTFQSEVNRLLHIIIHSLYKNKDIFLRELISNASDALEKLRYLSLSDAALKKARGNVPLEVVVEYSDKEKSLTVADTGIGMSCDDMHAFLGSIGKSGTAEFLDKLEKNKDALIGNFGVGFFSSFLVAKEVTVVSKKEGSPACYWTSAGDGTYAVKAAPDADVPAGTQVTLFLKDDETEYLNERKLEDLVKKYSEFINFPIYLVKTNVVTVPPPKATPKEEEDIEEVGDEENDPSEKAEEAAEEEAAPTPERAKVHVNTERPLWLRDPKEVTTEEYDRFYTSFTKDHQKPLAHSHFRAEGDLNAKLLLFIPAHAPNNLFQVNTDKSATHNIKLFVRRVFITDELDNFLPKWLSFVKGLIDVDDLELNVSRETLQQNRVLKMLAKKVMSKTIGMLKTVSEDKDKYPSVLKEYGASIKVGVIEDTGNRKQLMKLLRFHSSNGDAQASLEEYVARMPAEQTQIYFHAATDLEDARQSPLVEKVIGKGYEVLLFVDPVDEYLVQHVPDFEGKKFQNLAKDGLLLPGGTEDTEQQKETYKVLLDWFTENFSTTFDKVVLSTRLHRAPCAVIAPEHGWSGNMQRIMSAQSGSGANDYMYNFYRTQKKVLEVNPDHPVIRALLATVEEGDATDKTVRLASLMVESATLQAGYPLPKTSHFHDLVEDMIESSLGVTEKVEELPLRERRTKSVTAEKDAADEVVADEDLSDDLDADPLKDGHSPETTFAAAAAAAGMAGESVEHDEL